MNSSVPLECTSPSSLTHLVPPPEAPPRDVVLEEVDAADQVKHGLLTDPLSQAGELGLRVEDTDVVQGYRGTV